MRRAVASLVCCWPLAAAISNVRVLGTTATQAVLVYTAPDGSGCAVEVSESPAYQPLVHDVNPALFAGADQDSRPGSLRNGRGRTVVIGKREAAQGADGRYYSRALQAYTEHYYRIRCGTDTATGTFHTTNVPLGMIYNDPVPSDPASPGTYAIPSVDWTSTEVVTGSGTLSSSGTTLTMADPQHGLQAGDIVRITQGPQAGAERLVISAGGTTVVVAQPFGMNQAAGTTWAKRSNGSGNGTQRIIDPSRGWLLRLVTMPKQYEQSTYGRAGGNTLTGAAGTGWTTGAADLKTALDNADAIGAQYQGDGVTAPAWLRVTTAINAPTVGNMAWVSISIRGSANAGGVDGSIELCIATADGAGCRSAILTLDLGACLSQDCVVGNEFPVLAAWTDPAHPLALRLTASELVSSGILVRKKTNTAGTSVNLDQVQFNTGQYSAAGWYAGGGMSACSPSPVSRVYEGQTEWGYHCLTSEGRLWWFNSETGDAALISATYGNAVGTPGMYSSTYSGASFDPNDGHILYATAVADQRTKLLKLTYTGDHTDIGRYSSWSPMADYKLTVQVLGGGKPIDELVHDFTPEFDSQRYGRSYGYSNLPMCSVAGVVDGNKLKLVCFTSASLSAQDTLTWIAIFDLAQDRVVAAISTHGKVYPNRCGVLHSVINNEEFGGWIGLSYNAVGLCTSGPGCGPLVTETNELVSAVPNSDPAHDCACPAGVSFGRASRGGINRCSRIPVTGDLYDPNPYISADPNLSENSLRGHLGFLGSLQDAQPGDMFVLGSSERVQLLQKEGCTDPASPCAWILLREVDGTTASSQYAAGTSLACKPTGFEYSQNYLYLMWNYAADPTGATTAGFTQLPDMSHTSSSAFGDYTGAMYNQASPVAKLWCKSGHYSCYARFAGTPVQIEEMLRSTTVSYTGATSPKFAGSSGTPSGGDFHMSRLQRNAADADWLLDGYPFTPPTQTWSQVASTTNLFKYAPASFQPKIFPTEGGCMGKPLVDISPGPITDQVSDAYKMCAGTNCYPGTAAGEVVANCPGADPAVHLWAVSLGPIAHVYSQNWIGGTDFFGFGVRTFGELLGRPNVQSPFKNLKALPDASWAMTKLFSLEGVFDGVVAVKLPPFPPFESVNRSTFVPLYVQASSALAGADNVAVEFGYDANLRCSSRQETCVAAASTVSESVPFYWASEAYGGLHGPPWTIAIPAIPQRVVYYRLLYRDAANNVIGTGPMQVAVAP